MIDQDDRAYKDLSSHSPWHRREVECHGAALACLRSFLRLTAGRWFGDQQRVGLEAGYFHWNSARWDLA